MISLSHPPPFPSLPSLPSLPSPVRGTQARSIARWGTRSPNASLTYFIQVLTRPPARACIPVELVLTRLYAFRRRVTTRAMLEKRLQLSIKAPRPKRVKREYVDSGDEVEALTPAQTHALRRQIRQDKEKDKKVNHESTWITFGKKGGGMGKLTDQPQVLRTKISRAMFLLKYKLYMDANGRAWAPKDDNSKDVEIPSDNEGTPPAQQGGAAAAQELSWGLKLCYDLFYEVIKDDPECEHICARFLNDAKWRLIVLTAIWDRRCAQRNNLAAIARTMVDEGAWNLKSFFDFKTKRGRRILKNACLALLQEKEFIHKGTLEMKSDAPDEERVVYKVESIDHKHPYGNPLIAEYVARSMFSLGKDQGTMHFKPHEFPVESGTPKGTKPRSIVPRPMLTMAGTMLEVAIRDYAYGRHKPLRLDEGKVAEWYDEHVGHITEGTLIGMFIAANAWKPPKDMNEKLGAAPASLEEKEDIVNYFQSNVS
ncbi:unnamed protein product [Peniophora sp. CBMAI 1063]|nr:unnamed protein product [Peniophora sp. CBMAI 1063]